MDNGDHSKRKIFQQYLLGNLSEKEESALVEWINSSGKNLQVFKQYISENQFSKICSDDTNAAWQRIRTKLYFTPRKAARKKTVLPGWVKVAALIVFAFISGFVVNKIYRANENEYALNEVIVPKGEKSQLVLSDGSQVFLNSGSHIKYPAAFSRRERKVALSGEAFFHIEKNLSVPFVVETAEFNVKVTGTEFNLSVYSDDVENSVTLLSGSVAVEQNSCEYKIRPGEKFIFNGETKKSEIVPADTQKSSLWQKNIIVIDNRNLEEIRKVLERNFNVNIEIADEELRNIRYTGQFKPYETLEDIFNLIKGASPIKFKVEFNKTKDYVTMRKI